LALPGGHRLALGAHDPRASHELSLRRERGDPARALREGRRALSEAWGAGCGAPCALGPLSIPPSSRGPHCASPGLRISRFAVLRVARLHDYRVARTTLVLHA